MTTKPSPTASTQVRRLYEGALEQDKTEFAAGVKACARVFGVNLAPAKNAPETGKAGAKKPEKHDTDMTATEYERYLDTLGLPESPKRGALDLSAPEPETDLSDDEAYAAAEQILDGQRDPREAGRAAAEQQRESDEHWLSYYSDATHPLPLRPEHEHLRSRLKVYGY